MASEFDIIVIGAGIAGISAAAHLAERKRVAILEMEERPAYHTTGRSAAAYEPNYGPPPMLAFTRASHEFFMSPPAGFADGPLLTLRASLFLEAEGQEKHTEKLLALGEGLKEMTAAEARAAFPVLREDYARRTFCDPNTGDLDVDLLHRGYLRMFKARGGTLATNSEAKSIARDSSQWRVETPQGVFTAPVLVNAAGAWGDVIAARAGLKQIGLVPKRRSIAVIPAPDITGFESWPMVTDVGETWYAKPQSGKMIVSSADATPVDPHDAYADDMAIAEVIERLMMATTMEVTRLEHSWGGLRTFTSDGSPAIGFDPSIDGFFWLVGQGGYGIQSAPALSRTAAAMVLGSPLPGAVLEAGLNVTAIAPERAPQKTQF
jgi:D-arginine dehydrogenase